jgi:hypothetical protein
MRKVFLFILFFSIESRRKVKERSHVRKRRKKMEREKERREKRGTLQKEGEEGTHKMRRVRVELHGRVRRGAMTSW